MDLTTAPEDILCHIVSRLHLSSLGTASSLSKEWKERCAPFLSKEFQLCKARFVSIQRGSTRSTRKEYLSSPRMNMVLRGDDTFFCKPKVVSDLASSCSFSNMVIHYLPNMWESMEWRHDLLRRILSSLKGIQSLESVTVLSGLTHLPRREVTHILNACPEDLHVVIETRSIQHVERYSLRSGNVEFLSCRIHSSFH